MSRMSKDDWRAFEELIFQILLEEYDIQESEINKLTNETKDGGYDGIFYVPYSYDNLGTYQRMLKMLFEAKLRTDINKDLSLQEFSKALIIAINKNADRIIIATNLHFSNNTREILEQYAYNTGLSIQLKTSIDIFTWIQEHPRAVCNPERKKSLYNLLKNSYNVEKSRFYNSKITTILNDSETKIWPPVHGYRRNNKKNRVKEIIHNNKGIITIEGDAGIGKTVFLNNILLELKNEGINSYIFDFLDFTTPRTLFIDMMCKIWNIKYDTICLMESEDLENILCYLGDNQIDVNMNKIISNVLSISNDDYISHSDVYEYYLINYIYELYSMRNRKRKIILSFININSATKELLSFFLSICRKFGKELLLLLEIRTSYGENDTIDFDDWKDMQQKILNLPNIIWHCEIKEWEKEEIFDYIVTCFKPYEVQEQVCINLLKKIGPNPLYLTAYIESVKCDLNAGRLLSQNIESYIKSYEISNFNAILTNYITTVVKRSEYNTIICFTLAMLHGKVDLDIIETLLGNNYMTKLSFFLDDAKFVSKNNKTIFISHDLYLDSLKVFCDNMPLLMQQNMAEKLLTIKRISNPNTGEFIETKINLLKILGKTLELINQSVYYAVELFTQGQYNKSNEQFGIAYDSLYDLSENDILSNDVEFECRCGHLAIKLKLNTFQKNGIGFITEINQCKMFLLSKFVDHIPDDEIKLYLIEYRYYHLLGDFSQALVIAKKMVDIINYNSVSTSLASKVLSEYCIAIKETSSLNNALKEYKNAMKKYPDSVELKFARLSHLASKYGAKSPKAVMKFLRLNNELEPYLSMSDRFHNRVNILSCLFLNKKYEEAKLYGIELLNNLFIFGLKAEEGRAANNLGCTYWALGDVEEAKRLFEYGISSYNSGKYVAFLWPVLINRISLSLVFKDMKCKPEYADQCLEFFKINYRDRIRHFTYTEKYFDKLFVGIAILCIYFGNQNEYQKIKEITESIAHLPLKKALSTVNSYKDLTHMLKDTVYLHNGAVMIKS